MKDEKTFSWPVNWITSGTATAVMANKSKATTIAPEDRSTFKVNVDNIKPEDRRIRKAS